jgi:hypothetical protein
VRWIVVFVVIFTVIAVVNRHYSAPYGTVAGRVVLAMVAGLYAFRLTPGCTGWATSGAGAVPRP